MPTPNRRHDRYVNPPFWVERFDPGRTFPPAKECLATQTGIVHIPTLIADGLEKGVIPHTPAFFNLFCLPYGYDPKAPEPAEWLKFLASLWDDDPESIDCLQEWFGYCLTPEKWAHKMALFIGPRRSGKGTIARILQAMVGVETTAAPTLSQLTTPFGLQCLIYKTVCLITDARISGRADTQVAVERLLSITGDDPQTIDRKHQEAWSGEIFARISLFSNELPHLGDTSKALLGRCLLFRLTRSFFDCEDVTLTDRLKGELPSILNWAIEGYARLKARGRFVQPKSSEDLLEEFRELTDPVGTFLIEACVIGDDEDVLFSDLFEAWVKWCQKNGRKEPGSAQSFSRNLRTCLPSVIKMERPRQGGSQVRRVLGLGLAKAAPY